jgi:hypothetical protein
VTTLIYRQPCERCGDNRREVDTGAWYCAASPSGDYECPKKLAVDELVTKACASAYQWQHRIRHTPAEVKYEAIEAEAGMLEDWASALGAEFDVAAWICRCGEARAAA